MEDIKKVVSQNIVKLRKQNGLTQLALAEKINYSDKAVSRWENSEVLPDVETLNKIAELFNVSIDTLFCNEQEIKIKTETGGIAKKHNKFIVSMLCIVLVWALATVVYVLVTSITKVSIWEIFIHSIFVSFLLAVVFSALWGKRVWTCLFASGLMWSTLLSLYFILLKFNVWLLFTIGIPMQIAIILIFCFKRSSKTQS